MLVVGLTGSIATGKSTVSRLLASKGIPIIDADLLARDVVASPSVLKRITKEFGEDILAADGTLDRKKLGAVIFGDAAKRSKLNAIVHPRVRRAMVWNVLWMWATGKKICVLDIPLLIEGGLWKWVSKVILVYCTPETQLARLTERDGSSIQDAQQRIDSQMPVMSKLHFADYKLDNSGTEEELSRHVEELVKNLEKAAGWTWWFSWVCPPYGIVRAAWVLAWRTKSMSNRNKEE
ncbi:CoaE-domain-containing protein [Mycena floridula]|nr:CoaE-domain-containing protein [Mycena floridula]